MKKLFLLLALFSLTVSAQNPTPMDYSIKVRNLVTDGTATPDIAVFDVNKVLKKQSFSTMATALSSVLEYANYAAFPTTGIIGKIYVDKATNVIYRWSGSVYVILSPFSGVQTVTGTTVDNTDVLNPIVEVPTLQQVTDAGNTTTNEIFVQGMVIKSPEIFSTIMGVDATLGTTGTYGNTVFGSLAFTDSVGNLNTIIGAGAGEASQGSYKVNIGNGAGQNSQVEQQIAIGFQTGRGNLGTNQIAFGPLTGRYNEGDENIAIGAASSESNTGDYVIGIGNYSAYPANPYNNIIAIGWGANATADKQTVFKTGDYNVRLNTDVAADKLFDLPLVNEGRLAVTPITVSTNITAENDTNYIVTASSTITDPTGVSGKGYTVYVNGGVLTIDGVPYNVGSNVFRYFDGTVWSSKNFDNSTAVTGVSGVEPIIVTGPPTEPIVTILDAAADNTTKGAATFNPSDFNSSLGAISLDYANGQVASEAINGYMSVADRYKLNGIASGATANSTDAFLLARANHTGTQTAATISDFFTTVQTDAPAETNATIATIVNASTAAVPNNTDVIATADGASVKKLTWTNAKAFLKTYFDTIYSTGSGTTTLTGAVTGTGTGTIATTLASGVDATKIADGTVSGGEFQFINSVTSNVQTQLDGKQPLDSDLTAISSLVTDSFGRDLLTKTTAASVRTYIGAGTGSGDALVANPLSQFATTTSAQLASVISDETGSGLVVYNNTPSFITPLLGTPTSGNLLNCIFPTLNQNTTGTASNITGNLPQSQVINLVSDLALKADKSANLSDLASAKVARVNLGLDKITSNGDSNYTILLTDKTVATSATLTAPRNWTLPLANTVNSGYEIIVSDLFGGVNSTNTLTITRSGSDVINNATTLVIGAQFGARRLISDGVSKWMFDAGVMRVSDYIGTTLTANKVIVSDSNGKFAPSTTTTTQVGYLSGATGTTGTASTNIVYSNSPAFTGAPTVTGTLATTGTATSGISTPFTVVGGTGTSAGGWKAGALDAVNGAIYSNAVVTPSGSNFSLLANSTKTELNATTTVNIDINGSAIVSYNSLGATMSAGKSFTNGVGSATFSPQLFQAGTLRSTITAFSKETNTSGVYQTTAALNRYAEGGKIFGTTTDVSNVGITESDLVSYTTKANTLVNTDESLYFDIAGTFNDMTSTAQLQFYYGGMSIGNTGVLTISSLGGWSARIILVRSGATTAKAVLAVTTPGASTAQYTTVTSLTGLTFTNTNIIKCTGIAGGASGGTGDITMSLAQLLWYGASNN